MIFLDNLYSIVSQTAIDDQSVRYRVRLHPESVIFGAHFPGEPIMPGACIVQMVQELAAVWLQSELELVKVSNLKFLSVISPNAVLDLDVVLQNRPDTDGRCLIKADVMGDATVYTRMSLLLAQL